MTQNREGLFVDYESIAARLAHEDSSLQANFIKVFLLELRSCCKTNFNAQKQLSWICDDLSKEDRELLAMLGPEKAVI